MKIEKGSVYAIIPARSGSVSIKNKNIRKLGKYPLIAYSIAIAKMVGSINRVIVTTDSEYYGAIARSYGAEVPFIRPSEISGPYSTDLEFMNHAINWFDKNEKVLPEYWVHLRPTTPLRDVELIEGAIAQIKKDADATSLRSAHQTDLCPMKWFIKDSDGYLNTFCNITNDEANGPRQNFPVVFIPNGYVDILKTEHIVNTGKLHGNKIKLFEVPPTIDIDYENEFNTLENNFNQKAQSIVSWLDDYVNN